MEKNWDKVPWEHLGELGDHFNHHLRADGMSDVYCFECDMWLDDEEAELAWPMEDERMKTEDEG